MRSSSLHRKPLFNTAIPANFIISRGKRNNSAPISSLFTPVTVQQNTDDENVGAELTGTINKADLLKILNKFYQKREIKLLLQENGLDSKFYSK